MSDPFDAAFIKKVEAEIERMVIERQDKVAIHIQNRLVTRTPVDKGQARAGWNFYLNKASKEKPTRPKGNTVLAPPRLTPDQFAKSIGDSYFITNAVEHLVYLNEGHSEQAPANFIEYEIIQGVKDAEAFK